MWHRVSPNVSSSHMVAARYPFQPHRNRQHEGFLTNQTSQAKASVVPIGWSYPFSAATMSR